MNEPKKYNTIKDRYGRKKLKLSKQITKNKEEEKGPKINLSKTIGKW